MCVFSRDICDSVYTCVYSVEICGIHSKVVRLQTRSQVPDQPDGAVRPGQVPVPLQGQTLGAGSSPVRLCLRLQANLCYSWISVLGELSFFVLLTFLGFSYFCSYCVYLLGLFFLFFFFFFFWGGECVANYFFARGRLCS